MKPFQTSAIACALLLTTLFSTHCKKNDDPATLDTSDFTLSLYENPTNGQSLGHLDATTNQGSITFTSISQTPAGAFTIDPTTGEILVLAASLFDFETNPVLTATVEASNGSISKTIILTVTLIDVAETQTVQDRLNAGQTPLQIYNSDPTLLDELYGKTYKGGLIFYLNTSTGAGLVSAASDQGTLNWGCEGTSIAGTSTALGTGSANTAKIVAGCSTPNIAARVCSDLVLEGFSDWYLPSKDELKLMHQNLSLKGFGNFSLSRYWSSSQYNAQFAWCQFFNLNVNQLYYDKDLIAYPVRAIRSF